jgi:cytochrome c-type biogenesis protein CcmE
VAVVSLDDVASADETAPELDLTPRTGPLATATRTDGTRPTAPRRGDQRKWPWIVALVAIIGGIGFIASHALNDATQFFYNTDEAVAKQSDLGTKPFRLQGTVVQGTTHRTADGVAFAVTFNGVDVTVNHIGDPPELFQDCIPVVLEGHWTGAGPAAVFASNRILVKHSENYDAENPERLQQANAAGVSNACYQAGKTTPTSAPAGGASATP